MQILIKQSIKIYNQIRSHWSCNMLTTNQIHQQKNMKIKTYNSKNLLELKLSEI